VIVLDASAVLEWLLGRPAARAVAARIADPGQGLHVPHLLDVEVARALRRYEATGALPAERARAALEDLRDLDAERHGHALFLPRIWQLRRNLTAYDAAYVALAEALDAPLLTADARLARAPGHRARVEMLA
jgi:predicted nucleic acid-binding protein